MNNNNNNNNNNNRNKQHFPQSTFDTFHSEVILTLTQQYPTGEHSQIRNTLVSIGERMSKQHLGPKICEKFAPLSPLEFFHNMHQTGTTNPTTNNSSNQQHSQHPNRAIQDVLTQLWAELFNKVPDFFSPLTTTLHLAQISTALPPDLHVSSSPLSTTTPTVVTNLEKPGVRSCFVLRDENFRYIMRYPSSTQHELQALLPFTYITSGAIKGVLACLGLGGADVTENIDYYYGQIPVVSFLIHTTDGPTQTL